MILQVPQEVRLANVDSAPPLPGLTSQPHDGRLLVELHILDSQRRDLSSSAAHFRQELNQQPIANIRAAG